MITPANAVQNVDATVDWSQTGPSSGVSDQNGNLYRPKCATASDSDTIVMMHPDGSIRPAVNAATSSTMCATGVIVGKDGSQVYAIEQSQITAYDSSGVFLWTAILGATCTGWESESVVKAIDVKLGADGNLYALTGAPSMGWSCSPQVPTELVKIDAVTGLVSNMGTLTGSIDDGATTFKKISVWHGGVMLFEYNFSSAAAVRFFDYNGNEETGRNFTLDGQKLDMLEGHPEVSYKGAVVYTYTEQNASVCGSSNSQMKMIRYVSPSGNTRFIRGDCVKDLTYFGSPVFGPDESIHVTYTRSSDSHLKHMVMNPFSTVVYDADITAELSDDGMSLASTYGFTATIDISGNMIWVFDVIVNGQRSFAIKLVDTNGNTIAVFDATNQPEAGNNVLWRHWSISYTNGSVYAGVCWGQCTSWNQPRLYKIDVLGLGMDYPRGAMVAGTSFSSQQSLITDYVAMGDSFSSGEGNLGYMHGTDELGTNECHRSDVAYPEWLTQSPSESLKLTDFVACSGATTKDVLGQSEANDPSGKWNESPQVDALSKFTKVVTISIGGNDVGFAPYVETCVKGDCDVSTAIYSNTIFDINSDLPAKLRGVYEEILTRAENAQIYIVGYPYMAPSNTQPMPIQCDYFNSSNGAGLDAEATRQLVDAMNGAIDGAVEDVKIAENTQRLTFINPNTSVDGTFDGHDMCAGVDAYFHNVTWNAVTGTFVYPFPGVDNPAMMFHPNQAGQYEYFNIISGVIP